MKFLCNYFIMFSSSISVQAPYSLIVNVKFTLHMPIKVLVLLALLEFSTNFHCENDILWNIFLISCKFYMKKHTY